MKLVFAVLSAALMGLGWIANPGSSDMVLIEAGTVELGAPDSNSVPGPAPYYVKSFSIDRREVTNRQYQEFAQETKRASAAFAEDEAFNRPDQPVTGVTWSDAFAYCKWVGKRLPNQMEWEKAARGDDGRTYPWGNNFDAGFAHLAGDQPIAIASYPPQDTTPGGLVGMAGGVSEWVNDVQLASGGVCGRVTAPSEGGKSLLQDMIKTGGELAAFAPSCKVGELAVSPHVVAANQELSLALAKYGRPEWGVQKCAYIKGNNFNGEPHMTRLTNRMWDYTDTVAEFVGFRCARSEQ